jgi:subtilisin family serine protease
MSTERKTVVTLHKGVDGHRFMEEMADKRGSGAIPDRSVQIWNEKPESISNYDFVLSSEEAAQLKSDPRVREARWGTKKELGIFAASNVYEPPRDYSRVSNAGSEYYNWGLAACGNDAGDVYTSNQFEREYVNGYNLTGKDVDVIIMDDGVETTHPEWIDNETGFTRFQFINWPIAADYPLAVQDSGYYTENTGGHGTLCASVVAGRLYGWAKAARIYSMACYDNFGPTPNWMFGPSIATNLMRGFHEKKTTGRPTVVNASWAYFINWDFNEFVYRGQTYQRSDGSYPSYNPDVTKAMMSGRHPTRVTSLDSDIEDLVASGVHVVSTACNDFNYIDQVGGIDWDNNHDLYYASTIHYWCRGSTPGNSDGVTTVGSVDTSRWVDDGIVKDQMHFSSGRGPGIDIWAPGTYIAGAMSTRNGFESENPQPYPANPAFKMCKLTGTSFAAPQVTGILAQHLQLNPNITPAEGKKWLKDNADKDRLYDGTLGATELNYSNHKALNGAANLFLRNPYQDGVSEKYSGDIRVSKQ